jgi:tetratricopeptide (TPR) repeat protein
MSPILKKLKRFFYISLLLQCSFVFSQEEEKNKSLELDDETKLYIESFKDSMPIEDPITLIGIGYMNVYMGNNVRGNAIMNYAINKIPEPDYEMYHELSVQNTKNGNYKQAIIHLDLAANLNPEVYGYYGWIMLYYYRDYARALTYLEKYDSLTPNFSDFPAGENINFLKGMAYFNQAKYDTALKEFDKYIQETTTKSGEDWVEVSTFYYKALCHQFQNNYNEAILNYDKAIKYYDTFAEAFFQRGICFEAQQDKTKALKDFNTSKELIKNGFRKKDVYIEIFQPVYLQDVEAAMLRD